MTASPPAPIRRLRRLGHAAVLGLLLLGLGIQGLSQAVERIAAPSHRHLPRAVQEVVPVAEMKEAAPRSFPRDDHRRIPWIADEPLPAVEWVGDAHAHDGVAAHRHALGDADVIYVDADDDAAGSQPVASAGWPLPAAEPRLPGRVADGHAAWRAAPLWHALARSGDRLERPPR